MQIANKVKDKIASASNYMRLHGPILNFLQKDKHKHTCK